MEPEYSGWCRGCNGWSDHLKWRFVVNGLTLCHECALFCPECRERFGLVSLYEEDMDAKRAGSVSAQGDPERIES